MAAPQRFTVGSTDDYVVTSHLGEGSYGAVVMAHHHATGQAVAIKRFIGQPGDSAALREAAFLDICAGIPFVVGYKGLVRHPVTMDLRLVMECVHGRSLHDMIIDQRGQPPPELAVRNTMWMLLLGAQEMHFCSEYGMNPFDRFWNNVCTYYA